MKPGVSHNKAVLSCKTTLPAESQTARSPLRQLFSNSKSLFSLTELGFPPQPIFTNFRVLFCTAHGSLCALRTHFSKVKWKWGKSSIKMYTFIFGAFYIRQPRARKQHHIIFYFKRRCNCFPIYLIFDVSHYGEKLKV